MIEPEPIKILDDETCEILSPEEIAEEIEQLIYLRACDLVEEWECADPRDRWRYTSEQRPRTSEPARAAVQPYRTSESTQQAFWYVVRLADPERLAAWLDDHPKDETFLLNLLERK
jgi:hypothetical protein